MPLLWRAKGSPTALFRARNRARIWSLIALLIGLSLLVRLPVEARSASPTRLLVSVTASMTDVAHEIKPLFEREHPHVHLTFNVGSSGALAQQIQRGAPVDVFLSAAMEPMAHLADGGFIVRESITTLALNRLVLIKRARDGIASVQGWDDLAGPAVRRIAIGNPQHVPAGMYAREILQHVGLWNTISGKLIQTEDVRQALQYVRLGAVDAGVVYATDAATTADVTIVAEAPDGAHAPIIYPAGIVATTQHRQEAETLLRFWSSPEVVGVLQRRGFTTLE